MPSYLYSGPGERVYPEGRDASGAHIGTVTPGDIRIFDEPPADGWWTPEIPPRDDEGNGGGIESDPDPADVTGDPGSDEGAAGEPEHDGDPADDGPETSPGE